MLSNRERLAIRSFQAKLKRLESEKINENWSSIFAGIKENIILYFGENSNFFLNVKFMPFHEDFQKKQVFISLCKECINHINESGLPPKRNILYTLENWKILAGTFSIFTAIAVVSFNIGSWKSSSESKEREIEYKIREDKLKDSLTFLKNNSKGLFPFDTSSKVIPNKLIK